VLEEGSVRPVGADYAQPIEAWVIAATNVHLETKVKEKTFRADLYHRLNVAVIELPPLAKRKDDILLLARHFLAVEAQKTGLEVAVLSPAAEEKLLSYHWPGNVRELANTILRAVIHAPDGSIQAHHIVFKDPSSTPHPEPATPPSPETTPLPEALDELRKRYLIHALWEYNGSVKRAAAALGYSPGHVHRLIEKFKLNLADFRGSNNGTNNSHPGDDLISPG